MQEDLKPTIQENQVDLPDSEPVAGGFPHTRAMEGPYAPAVTPGGKPVFPLDSDLDDITKSFSDNPGLPLLVNNGQSRTSSGVKLPWTRKQCRTYRTLINWMSLKSGQGYQLLRVDLTSIKGGGEFLTENFKALRRVVENTFHYRLEYFKVETSEGHGVLHMVWAIKYERAVWIPQKWLSREWEKISGASIVWIARLGASRDRATGGRFNKKPEKEHIKKIAGYFAGQYLALQDAIVHVSWSWWRNGLSLVKAFKQFRGLTHRGIYVIGRGLVYDNLRRWELFEGWGCLLSSGWWASGNKIYYIDGREIRVKCINILGG